MPRKFFGSRLKKLGIRGWILSLGIDSKLIETQFRISESKYTVYSKFSKNSNSFLTKKGFIIPRDNIKINSLYQARGRWVKKGLKKYWRGDARLIFFFSYGNTNMYIYRFPSVLSLMIKKKDNVNQLIFKSLLFSISYVFFG